MTRLAGPASTLAGVARPAARHLG